MTTAPYGSWTSPITSEVLVEKVVTPSQLLVEGDDVYWNELRPADSARQVIVKRRRGAAREDLLAPPYSARTLVHEYGGQCFAVGAGEVFFSNLSDQRLYRREPNGVVGAITPAPEVARAVRFADPVVSPDGRWLVCVRERHGVDGVAGARGVVNDLVAVPTDGSRDPVVVAEGHDFYGAPRLSPDGRRLVWLSWDHPNMPWDGTELWGATLDAEMVASSAERIAGGRDESISQPRFSNDNVVFYLSDRSGFWNLYDERGDPVAPLDAEFGGPDWVFGQSSFTFLADGRIVVACARGGGQELGIVVDGVVHPVDVGFTVFSALHASGGSTVVCCAGSATEPLCVVHIDVDTASVEVLASSREVRIDPGYVSVPRHIEFPTEGGLSAHALFYAPCNKDFDAPAGELAPLIVQSHGGPTSNASQLFDPKIQFWTSRGFALVDVDYGGSTGYGRAYRERLTTRWGITDVDDCVNAARHLAAVGTVDGARMVIHGGSAGGYTTLAALTFRSVFAAGASHFGVSDLATLASDTHKFESRYLDKLVGPYPEAAEVYAQRSPIHHVDQLRCPMIFFQGEEDEIVPPAQAETMVAALKGRAIPVAYLSFAGEQHGFRMAQTIKRVAEAELYFYGRVLGFVPADEIAPVDIDGEVLTVD